MCFILWKCLESTLLIKDTRQQNCR
uniref:Uncharacterized protein n=1 Tax=Anguilla anguilla TaxID=7936 RepID=A0A0E9RYF4_ANGAN